MRPVLTSLGADNVLRGCLVLDRHVSPEAADGVAETAYRLGYSLAAVSRGRPDGARRGLAPAL